MLMTVFRWITLGLLCFFGSFARGNELAVCPPADTLNHYVVVPFDPVADGGSPRDWSIQVYYRTIRPFDSAKKTLLVMVGGPGDEEREYDSFFKDLVDDINIVFFDHRGTGCTQPLFSWPGNYIEGAFSMRRTAADTDSLI